MTHETPAAAQDLRRLGGGRRIDVHQHVILPEYEKALQRSGALDPSRPPRKKSEPAQVLEQMAGLGIDAALLNPVNTLGVHHGDDANARYL